MKIPQFFLSILLLGFCTEVASETPPEQASLLEHALVLEDAGNYEEALLSLEEALLVGGKLEIEIRTLLSDYYSLFGMEAEYQENLMVLGLLQGREELKEELEPTRLVEQVQKESPWSGLVSMGPYLSNYLDLATSESKNYGDLSFSLDRSFSSTSWEQIISLGVSGSEELKIPVKSSAQSSIDANELSSVDTRREYSLIPSVGYSLFGNDFFFILSADLNKSSDLNWIPGVLGILGSDLYRGDENTWGASVLGMWNQEYPEYLSTDIAWTRTFNKTFRLVSKVGASMSLDPFEKAEVVYYQHLSPSISSDLSNNLLYENSFQQIISSSNTSNIDGSQLLNRTDSTTFSEYYLDESNLDYDTRTEVFVNSTWSAFLSMQLHYRPFESWKFKVKGQLEREMGMSRDMWNVVEGADTLYRAQYSHLTQLAGEGQIYLFDQENNIFIPVDVTLDHQGKKIYRKLTLSGSVTWSFGESSALQLYVYHLLKTPNFPFMQSHPDYVGQSKSTTLKLLYFWDF